jgi:hypothetical protein
MKTNGDIILCVVFFHGMGICFGFNFAGHTAIPIHGERREGIFKNNLEREKMLNLKFDG